MRKINLTRLASCSDLPSCEPMKARKIRRNRGGFTLVELMIVVAIVGVLSVLAVFGVRKYIANAKTAEAKNSLGQIGKDAVTSFEAERMTPVVLAETSTSVATRMLCGTGAAGFGVPAATASIQGKKYQSSKADWSDPGDVRANNGFPCLKFEMTAPQYYQYTYTATGNNSDGDTFVANANGDLNGDLILSTFSMAGKIQSQRLTLAPSIGEVNPEE